MEVSTSKDPWFGVEIRHLEVLVALAQEESFHGAADRLGYVQSAISQRLATLEQLVGSRLVDRSRGSHSVRLTDPGALLVRHAETILALLSVARDDLTQQSPTSHTVRLGVTQSVAPALLPLILRGVREHSDGLVVLPVEAPDDRIESLLKQGVIDAAIGHLPAPEADVESMPFLSDFGALLFDPQCEWATELATPTAAAIARMPLVGASGDRHLARVETWLNAEGLRTSVMRVPTETTARALAAADRGVAVVSSLSIPLPGEGTEARSLEGLLPGHEVSLHWRACDKDRPELSCLQGAARSAASQVQASKSTA